MPIFSTKFAQNSPIAGVSEEYVRDGIWGHLKELLQSFLNTAFDSLKTALGEGIHYAAIWVKTGIQEDLIFVFNVFLMAAKKLVLVGDSLAANLATLIAQLLEHFPGSFGK